MNENEAVPPLESSIKNELSTKLDTLLQECDTLINNSKLHQEIDRNFIAINERFEELKKTYSPKNSIKLSPSKNIDNYIKHRFNSVDISEQHFKPSTHLKQFSFEMYKNGDSDEFMTKQKRKFGTFWQEASQSFDNRYVQKLPEIEKKPGNKRSYQGMEKKAQKEIRNGKLECIIKEEMGKRLGLRYGDNPAYRKNNLTVNKRKSVDVKIHEYKEKIQQPKMTKYFEDEEIDQEYFRYLHNPSIRIKLEKILIAQHTKKRKQYLLLSD